MTKLNLFYKTFFLIKIVFIFFIICLKSNAENTKTQNDLVVLGLDDAPVKIKIFSSLTCPHCANFHINVIPKIKKEYVDSGKVQLIFIDFPLDQVAFNASKLIYCLDQKKQIVFLDNIYKDQNKWTSGSNINEINNNLKEIVKILGINSNQFDKCVNSEIIADKILIGRINGQKKYSINSTTSFKLK